MPYIVVRQLITYLATQVHTLYVRISVHFKLK